MMFFFFFFFWFHGTRQKKEKKSVMRSQLWEKLRADCKKEGNDVEEAGVGGASPLLGGGDLPLLKQDLSRRASGNLQASFSRAELFFSSSHHPFSTIVIIIELDDQEEEDASGCYGLALSRQREHPRFPDARFHFYHRWVRFYRLNSFFTRVGIKNNRAVDD